LEALAVRFITSRDGTRLRVAVWNQAADIPRRGVCVILDGQTEFLEKYVEVADELRRRGFAVAALDWRGQGGSARALPDPLKAHISDFSEYDDDLTAFLEQVVAPLTDRPPLALAHSMGGNILIRALHDRPALFAAAVMTAPMLRADARGFPDWLVQLICRMQNRFGRANDFVWGMEARDPLHMAFEDNRVTSDRARFARAQAALTGREDIRLAGPTWGWLAAAYRAMARIMAPGFAAAIQTPVLIVGAGRDRIVQTSATREFARRLPHGTYLEIAEAEHEILMESDAIRAQFWAAFDAFVQKNF
jgi:lysophospholipase